ncbi:DUF3488 and DUF4129 domain-containing transglutaminase family protein [Spirulina sp. 06S082]|uniref:transglutaminase TgpA family protein n=1 Tax=Spirulina sp. 06S082 TaxID=3110248 RepID=UPI002B20A683|nr:DUF3488 and DUF4129 domain-containing transglutaminase family protein [Spirulina sp. 06S082]MEA5470597.1 DUF3488 and DUF4129 domain-containing transglutaminase family protein [Spirulina sp. 06S082]
MDSLKLHRIPGITQLWERLQTLPKPKTEESISLRVLVQVLVIIGIVATDIAADTTMSAWAIPLSLTGGAYSWYRRKKRNIAMKFIIAMGMLGTLVYFFGNLLNNLNDTRLVLAELLIQLQVLHSFDLPRRKDLGYSMIIGLILLGVAGTLSETLAFAPFPVLFLTIALPVLVLDYRSRLGFDQIPRQRGEEKPEKQPQKLPFSLTRLVSFLAIVMAIGLLIFALMPRFPGYQLQTFPVTSSIEFENERFNDINRRIFNPGVRNGQEGENGEATGEGENGEAIGDDSLYYGFQSQIDQSLNNSSFSISKVVLRVRSQAPGFWRVLAFDRYTGKGWEISRDDKLLTISRPPWSYRFFLTPSPAGETRSIIQTYTVVDRLPNLLPALYQARSVYFPTPEVALDPEGSIRVPVTLGEDLTYTVVSDVPSRDRAQLGQASTKYPQTIRKYYLQIPPESRDKIRQQAEKLLSKATKPITNPYEKALFLAQALKQSYSVVPTFQLEEGEDLVETFLFKYQGGYPDHFATVLTVMLRSLDIPSRLSVGFATGQFNPFTGFYLVRNTDAYALTEVYFPDRGWFSFDPLPGHEIVPPSWEENATFGVLRQFWHWVAGWLPSPVTSFLSYIVTKVIEAIAWVAMRIWLFVSSSAIGFFSGLIGAIAFAFLSWLTALRVRSWYRWRNLAKLPPMERLYQQMLQVLAAKGYNKNPAQTPLEYAATMREQLQQGTAEIIIEISRAYVQWRYGEQNPNMQYLRQRYRNLWQKSSNSRH